MKDHDKKTEQKMKEIDEMIANTNKRINSTRDQLQEDTILKISYFEKKMQNNITAQEFELAMGERISQINKEFRAVRDQQDKFRQKMEEEVKTTTDNINKVQTKLERQRSPS
jgi:hypothetical protein